MNSIQNSSINTPTPFNKTIAGFTCVLAITAIALAVIGLTASTGGPFNVIVGLGSTTNGILLGTSIFVLILDLVWIATLCKQKKALSVSQSELVQEVIPASRTQTVLDSNVIDSSIEGGLDPVSYYPTEVSLTIFSYLSGNELGRSCRVSKQWHTLASMPILWNALDLRKLSPSLKVFDELDWTTHIDLSSLNLSIADAPPSDKRKEIPVLKRLLSSLSIEGNSGVTLLTIPKGLTLNKLVKLARSPKLGNATNFKPIWNRITEELGDIPVDKTYRIVITNNVFEASRNLSVNARKNLVHKSGCEMPSILEASTLLVVTYMSSQQRLYNDNPRTYTLCLGQVDGYPLIVGGFAPAGLVVDYDDDFSCAGVNLGVGGALRKF